MVVLNLLDLSKVQANAKYYGAIREDKQNIFVALIVSCLSFYCRLIGDEPGCWFVVALCVAVNNKFACLETCWLFAILRRLMGPSASLCSSANLEIILHVLFLD